MALIKKSIPMGGSALSDDGVAWYWETSDFAWRWRKQLGLNVSARPRADVTAEFVPLIFVGQLAEAVMWSYGYEAGREAACTR